jgi:hypothetical protein
MNFSIINHKISRKKTLNKFWDNILKIEIKMIQNTTKIALDHTLYLKFNVSKWQLELLI